MAEIVSQPTRQYSQTGEEICTLCCEESSAWAIGSCDHFVCLTCSARLRVLCEKKECPICRERNDKIVVFTKPRSFVVPPSSLKDRKYGFIFAKSSLFNYYENIRALRCTQCDAKSFYSMRNLAEHTRREHGLMFCEICVQHLKLFPNEHKLYNRHDLVRHRREGDLDDKSHKGHPQCDFCDERYFGKDELFFHLKKNHFWCHFCEQSGTQEYYPTYEALKGHFLKDHYLCEEGDCRHEKFVNVFLSKLDLQVHKAKVHTKGLSKNEAKQLRQIDVGFTYARKERGDGIYRRQYQQQGGQMSEQRNLETAIALSLNEAPREDYHIKETIEQKQDTNEGGVSRDRSKEGGVSRDRPKEGGVSRDRPKEGTISRDRPKVDISKDRAKEGGVSKNRAKERVTSRREEEREERKDTRDQLIKLERKKPPGLEHLEPTRTIMAAAVNIETKMDKDEEEVGDEWPTLGLESLQIPQYTNPPPLLVTNAGPPGLPVLPPPGFTPVTNSVKSVTTEFSVLDEAIKLLKRDPDKINNFKSLSGQYQKGRISVFEYNKKCSDLFGYTWKEFGCHLAGTLPDLSRRQELFSVILNNNDQTVSQPKRRPPPGFTNADTTSSGSINSSNISNGGSKEGKRTKKKRNRNGGNTDSNSNGTTATSSHSGVWNSSSSIPAGIKVHLKDSEFPTLGVAAHIPDPTVSMSAWNMKVVVK